MKIDFPKLIYYDQDFIQGYRKTWLKLEDFWSPNPKDTKSLLFHKPNSVVMNQFETIMSAFSLVYQERPQLAAQQIDFFYQHQEEDGAIRGNYDFQTGEAVPQEGNPQNVSPPLFAWLEFHLYHKVGLKKRMQEVFPKLEQYFQWVDREFRDEELGLLKAPLSAVGWQNSARQKDGAVYLIDFNAQQLLNAYYMAVIGDLLNDKEIAFRYRKYYFSLKTRVMSMMWNPDTQFFYDLDAKGKLTGSATLCSYWIMLCDVLNEERLELMIAKLTDPKWFGSVNPFPCLAQHHPDFSAEGRGCYGSVMPPLTFVVVKGLEIYQYYRQAREFAIMHMYHILDTYFLESDFKNQFWQVYMPYENKPALVPNPGNSEYYVRASSDYAHLVSLITVNLFIETIIGLNISLPRKTVDWMVATLEEMGVRNLSLRRNIISIQTRKSARGWEIRLESEKLYYFTVDILDHKKKTLPIPSGKCSMLVDKL
ncbi:trehalase family glycosidase [Candidatus Haliotispira prima]|uniref:Trehalase family glycosidase n=1 Tax=Candidatus Haliotispira prima TaxID=3034016 RepID=A0ABY8MLY4_9SPIO|nr:trehalase family glycosidase [Candidatus Haliotispira prima]